MNFRYVHYHPWIGSLYRDSGLWGKRVLIVGHSHYDEWEDQKQEIAHDASFTNRCIAEWCNGEGGSPFWTRLRNVIGGSEYRERPGSDFYGRIVFYNFLQTVVDGGAHVPLNLEQIRDPRNESAFLEVLEAVKPERMIALGSANSRDAVWSSLPSAFEEDLAPIRWRNQEFAVCTYKLADGMIVNALQIPHPAGGLSNEVHEVVRRFIDAPLRKKGL